MLVAWVCSTIKAKCNVRQTNKTLHPNETTHPNATTHNTSQTKWNFTRWYKKRQDYKISQNKYFILQSKKTKQNVPLAEEEEEVQQLEVGEFRKKATTVKSCGISCSFSKFSTTNKIWSEFSTNRIWSETWRKKNSFIISTMSSDLGLKYIFWKALPYFRQWNQCTLATNPVTTVHPKFSHTILIATKVPF